MDKFDAQITFPLPLELKEKLWKIARENGSHMSVILRQLIMEYVASNEKK